ncbi:MAG: hypothetical protein DIU78_005960 [Pseudomonadota bacterium]
MSWGLAENLPTSFEGAAIFLDPLDIPAELARAEARSLLPVTIPAPGPAFRGRLALLLEEAVEEALARRGACPPGIGAAASLDAALSDQLYRSRLLELRGITIALPSLEGIATLGGMLDAEDGAVLRFWVDAARSRPIRLLIDVANQKLKVYGPPEPFASLLREPEPPTETPAPPPAVAPEVAESTGAMELSEPTPAVIEHDGALAFGLPLPDGDDEDEETVALRTASSARVEASDARSAKVDASDAASVSIEASDASVETSNASVGASEVPSASAEANDASLQAPDETYASVEAGIETRDDEARGENRASVGASDASIEARDETHASVEASDDDVPTPLLSLPVTEAPRTTTAPAVVRGLDEEAFGVSDDEETRPLIRAQSLPLCNGEDAASSPLEAAVECPSEHDHTDAEAAEAPPSEDSLAKLPQSAPDVTPDAPAVRLEAKPEPAQDAPQRPATPEPKPRLEIPPLFPEAAATWTTWMRELEGTRGPKPLAVIERTFVTSYVPLAHAVAEGIAEGRAAEVLGGWSKSFAQSYREAFEALRVRGKRPTMVLDAPDLAQRIARLHGARSVQLVLVDAMRFDLGLRIEQRVRALVNHGAVLAERLLLWSALPSTTAVQIDLIGRGPAGLAESSGNREVDTFVARGRAASTPRRIKTGPRDLLKLDVIEARLSEPGPSVTERLDALADEAAYALADLLSKQAPRTLLFAFGDHGFVLDPHDGGTAAARQGGSSPEEVLVPAFAWLAGGVH